MDKVFKFGEQNQIGQAGERLLVNTYEDLDYYDVDHSTDLITDDGRKVELKTDTYSMSRTPNFFMELYSNDTKFDPGGPHQALAKGSEVFIYMFIHNKVLFVFEDIQALIDRVYMINNKYNNKMITIKNKGYNTLGHKIPRSLLQDLYREVKLGDDLWDSDTGGSDIEINCLTNKK